jgi:uncharacterized protein
MRSPSDNPSQFVERALSEIRAWVECEPAARALALVGSYARSAAHEDSDVDLLILVEDSQSFVRETWLEEIDWRRLGASPAATHVAQYGVVWSSHVQFDNGLEVEFAFAPLSWAAARPLDTGTRRVISDGFRILYDPDGLLAAACAETSNNSRQDGGKAIDAKGPMIEGHS